MSPFPTAAPRRRRWVRPGIAGVGALAGGLGTAVLAVPTALGLVACGVLQLVGIRLLKPMLRVVRAVADCERDRLNQLGHDVPAPYPTCPTPLRSGARARATRRDLAWLGCHVTLGLLLGVLGVALPLVAVREATFPLWWWLLPSGESSTALGLRLDSWPEVLANAGLALGWAALTIVLAPRMAAGQMWASLRLLPPHPDADLPARVAELTATRAGALRAHATELRRIERALHDGTQNRLAGVVVLLAIAQLAVPRDPASAQAAIQRAQQAAEDAPGELRTVVGSILPPAITDCGLDAALAALAADCPVPCHLSGRGGAGLPVSVEATAYFVVAEALTNAVRHSRASRITVEVSRSGDGLGLHIADDGRGGARYDLGTGLPGIRDRVAAHDGDLTLSSPAGGPTTLEVRLPCGS